MQIHLSRDFFVALWLSLYGRCKQRQIELLGKGAADQHPGILVVSVGKVALRKAVTEDVVGRTICVSKQL